MFTLARTARRTPILVAAALVGAILSATAAYAIAGGTTVPDGTYGFVARVDVSGERACSGALVASQWIATAATCFAENGVPAPDGPPQRAATATIGTTVLNVVRLVTRIDRNVVLAQLATPAGGVPTIPVAATVPTNGETLQVAGYGRTATDWVPDKPHAAAFTVNTVAATTLGLTGTTGDTCKGDAGGPAFRSVGGRYELVALNDTSWQHGCLAVTGANQGSYEARVDDLADWIVQQTTQPIGTVAFGVSSDGVYHLFSANAKGVVYETYWKGGKTLTTAKLTDLGAPLAAIVYATTPDGYYHLFSASKAGAVAETYWKPGVSLATQKYADLGVAVSSLAFQITTDGVYHLFSGTASGAVYETYWNGGKAPVTGKLVTVGGPVSTVLFTTSSDGYYHVFTGTTTGSLYESYWKPNVAIQTQKYADLGSAVNSIAFQVTSDGVYHLISGTAAGGVHETSWNGGRTLGTARLADLGRSVSSVAFQVTSDGFAHVFAVTSGGAISDAKWKTGTALTTTKLGDVGQPIAAVAFLYTSDGYYHVFSSSYANSVQETYWKAGTALTTSKLGDVPNS